MSAPILLFAGDDFEDLELMYPLLRLREAGYAPVVAGFERGVVYRGKHGYPCKSDAALGDVAAEELEGVVIPGGWMPDKLRREPRVLELVKAFDAAKKLLASICHGPWICISAGVVRGVRYTSSPGIKDDLRNAGALWSDAPLVVDGHHVSSRRPDDLPQFMAGVLEFLSVRAK
jgi:protease I